MELRDYQHKALRAVNERLAAGVRRLLLQAPTGSGKTVIAVALMMLAAQQRHPILFVAHRIELIDQTVDKLLAWGVPSELIGVIRSGDPRMKAGAPIQVASVQSLKSLPSATVIFIDEAHRSAAKTYAKIFEGYPDTVIIGLTGTPERLDGRPLGMYQEIIVVAQPHELAIQGYIASPIIYGVPKELAPELEGIKVSNHEYSQKQIAVLMKQRKLVGAIPDHWLQHAEDRLTIAFCADIEHSKQVCQSFLDRGIRACHADGNMAAGERKKFIQRVRGGEFQVVCQVDLWVEGVDIEELKCAILARPTYSLTVFLQSIGRIVRPYRGITPLVLDHACNTLVHGMPFEPRTYSLTGRVRRIQGKQIVTQCKKCLRALPADTVLCPDCGTPLHDTGTGEGAQRVIRTADGVLVEMPYDEATIRQMFWNRKIKEASQMGFQMGWCNHEFKERFGDWPPFSWSVIGIPPREASDEEKRKELRKLQAIAHKLKKQDDWVQERYHRMFNDTPRALLERSVATSVPAAHPVQEERIKMEI